MLAAAKAAGADAIHPGYGFLSENADFARAVIGAGLTWVGPTPESIDAMGSKIGAKELMRKAGVPTLEAPENPSETDLPLLVKASAGGGGRGMRVVRALADLDREIAAAQAEAESAFGDGTVFVEPYVERGRHVEVQVVGTSVYGDRDCSLQRRHQKVVEEAPAPGLSEEVRAALHDAARKAAEAIDYRGAGTVEFLYDPATERFWFLEMNTRLQVEHPVTELVHGIDLVELQIAAAEADWSMGWTDPPRGHAIEVRLYAEDPRRRLPAAERYCSRMFDVPLEEGIRVDAGFESGSDVSHPLRRDARQGDRPRADARPGGPQAGRGPGAGADPRRARRTAISSSPRLRVSPPSSPVDVSTTFLDDLARRPGADLQPGRTRRGSRARAGRGSERERRTVQRGIPVALRNVVSQPQVTEFDEGTRVEWWGGRDGYVLDDAAVVSASPTEVTLEREGVRTTYAVAVVGDAVDVDWSGGHVALRRTPRFVDPADAVASGSLLAPMPGTVVSVAVEPGQQVEAGQPVLVLEAMKMQHTVRAPGPGTVTEIDVKPGAQVAAGEVLAVVEEAAEETEK